MDRFEEVKKEVSEIIKKSPDDFDLQHAEAVLSWIIKLKPDADEALRIAAFSHDIDRAVGGIQEGSIKDYAQTDQYKQFKKEHAARSANIICGIIKKYNYPDEVFSKVRNLVEHHEVGGDYESDILRDADSLAFLESSIPAYLKRYGEERTMSKVKFMYERISASAKKLVANVKYQDKIIAKLVGSIINESNLR